MLWTNLLLGLIAWLLVAIYARLWYISQYFQVEEDDE